MKNIDESKLYARLEEVITGLMEIPRDSLTSRSRAGKFTTGRRILAHIMREVYGVKGIVISQFLRRDHSSVCAMLNRENHLSNFPALMGRVQQVLDMVAKEFPAPEHRKFTPVELEGKKEPDKLEVLMTRVNALERQLKYLEKKVGIMRY